MRRTDQGILLIDRNGGDGVSKEGDDGMFNPVALFPRVLVIKSHPRVYAFHAGPTTVALRIWPRIRARSCGCGWENNWWACQEYD